LGQFRDTASDYMQKGKEQVSAMGDTLHDQIQDRPMSSVLIAAGVGFLLGVLLTRRS
jgi:ElaB/YqjD/DUF883 family membrane-anchored ribosome-binding protein